MPANAENGRPDLFSSGFGTGSEHVTSRTRWRGLRRAAWPERVSRRRAVAHSSGELAQSEESEREGKKGSESSLATLRNSGAVNLSRRSGEAAASRARRTPMAAAARVSRARRLRVEAGVQRRSTALFIGPGGVALACAPREGCGEACPGRTRLRGLAAHGREEGPDGRGPRRSDGERGEAEQAGER